MIRTGLFSYLDQIDRLSHVKVIALTGGIGSGKSLVANYFFSLGAEVIDADQLARQAIERGSEGFDADAQEWKPGYEAQREEWERQYAEAQARFMAHKKQKDAAKAAEATESNAPAAE